MPPSKRKSESAPNSERATKKFKSVKPKKSKFASASSKEQDSTTARTVLSAELKPSTVVAVEGEAFRRGGADLLTPLEKKQIQAKANEDALYEEEYSQDLGGLLDSEGEAIEVSKSDQADFRKKSKKRARDSLENLKIKTAKSPKVDGLSYKRIHKGLVVLGCITRIGQKDITLALPNNLAGFVPIASISAGLREQLAQQDEDSSDVEENTPKKHTFIDLTKFVRVGKYLRAVVTSISDGSKKRIELSTMPMDVNAGVDDTSLAKYLTLQGEISSIEDHGVIVNLGMISSDTKAFISSAELGGIDRSTLQIGCPMLCSVISLTSNGKVVKLSTSPQHFDGQHALKTVSDVNSLLPGTVLEFTVSGVEENGIRGRMMDLVDVTADSVHSRQVTDADPGETKASVGKKMKARVIFTSMRDGYHHLGVSILPHIMSLSPPDSPDFDSTTSATDLLPVSTVVDEMTVTKVDPIRGLLMDVGIQNIPGFVHISRLSDKRVKDLSATAGPWRQGTIHKGRIVGYNPIDAQFLASLEKSILDLPFLSFEDAQPGQIVSGTVTKYKSQDGEIRGIIVKITDTVSGLVPANHLSDVQLQFPERKFKMDSVVRARVLAVDRDRRRITLTCKKTMLNSQAAVWSSYSDVHVGADSLGTVVSFLPSGALVEFYNHLKGFLPTSEMSESFIRDPKDHFRIGQVTNLRAIAVDPSIKRLVVSCRQYMATTDAAEEQFENLTVGMVVSGKVSEKLSEELVVDIQNTGIKAILPISHLTDGSEQKCSHAAKRIRVDQVLQDLAIVNLNKTKRYIRLTKKPSLINASNSGKFPSSFNDLAVDMEVTGFVKNIVNIGVFVQFGNNLTGLLPKYQLPESSVELPDFGLRKSQSIKCRVLSMDPDQQRFFLTQKTPNENTTEKSKTATNDATGVINPVDGNSTEYTLGQLTKAKIKGVKETQLNVKLAENVQGRVDISQIFDTWDKIKHKKHPLRNFQNGQTIDVRILGVHDARNHRFLPITRRHGNTVFELTARPSDQTTEPKPRLNLANMKIGESYLCFVNNVRSDHVWVNIDTEIRGRIHAMELTDNPEEMLDLSKYFPIGCALQARVIQINAAENRLDLSARPVDKARPQALEDLSVGQLVIGKVGKVLEKLVIIQLSDSVSGAIHICDLEDDFTRSKPKDLRPGQAIPTFVLDIDKDKEEVWLSTRPSRLSKPTAMIRDPELFAIQDVKVNDTRRGFITNITDQGLFISLSRDLTAFVRVSELFDQFVKNWKEKFNLNQLVEGKIIAVREAVNQIQMSLKQSVLDSGFMAPLSFEDIEVGQVHTGQVRKVEDFGVFVVFDKSRNVSGLCHRTEIADDPVTSIKDLYNEGDQVKVRVLKIDSGRKRISLGMKASLFPLDIETNQHELSNSGDDDHDIYNQHTLSAEEAMSSDGDDGGVEISAAANGADDLAHRAVTNERHHKGLEGLEGLDIGGFDWTGGLADTDDDVNMMETNDQPTTSTKKRHGASLIQIDQTGDLDTNGAQSVSDFERLLMGQPNSSYLWLSYMAFYLQLSEVEKARQIAERALRTINRESTATQDEALNLWIGFLNLENSYGSDETVDDVFKRACTYADPKEVYTRLTSIYIQSGKQDKATALFESMIKKFSPDPKVWQNYASFLFDVAEDAPKARALLPRAMQSLPGHVHIDITTKFAHLEFKSTQGDKERGRTIFEGLISNFPKRLDLWNVLLDLEIKSGSKEQVRQLFDRVTSGKIKAQKAKFFFKKWLDYEEGHGDDKSQEKVKAKAAEFVRKQEETRA